MPSEQTLPRFPTRHFHLIKVDIPEPQDETLLRFGILIRSKSCSRLSNDSEFARMAEESQKPSIRHLKLF